MALTAAQARTRSPGKYRDGHGLLLHVVSAEKRYWVFRYQRDGRERAMSSASPRREGSTRKPARC
jgi:hypothetical protein